MFHNTENGDYQDNGLVTTYTFPKEAAFNVNNVSIPLGGITIRCFGGRFDHDSIKHFTEMASLLRSNDKNCSIYNTGIILSNDEISGRGYPVREDFTKNGLEYLNSKAF